MDAFAFITCSRTSAAASTRLVCGSISCGYTFARSCCISVVITVVAMPLATSPAL